MRRGRKLTGEKGKRKVARVIFYLRPLVSALKPWPTRDECKCVSEGVCVYAVHYVCMRDWCNCNNALFMHVVIPCYILY